MRGKRLIMAAGALAAGALLALPAPARGADDSPAVARLARVYSAEIGVREASGRNDGARVEEYLRSVGMGAGHPWCAAFVSWAFREAGIRAACTAWAPAWFPAARTVRTGGGAAYVARRGDVFGIYSQSLGRIAHVGFIDGEAGGFCITVEGNTNEAGSRDGDGVLRKRRAKRTIFRVSRWVDPGQ